MGELWVGGVESSCEFFFVWSWWDFVFRSLERVVSVGGGVLYWVLELLLKVCLVLVVCEVFMIV